MNIFIGYDPREHEAYLAARHSILSRTDNTMCSVIPLTLNRCKDILTRPIQHKNGKLWCPISKAPMSTEFAISRFCVPFFQRTGFALFVDCDIICLTDIKHLFELADSRYAIQVVKHKYVPKDTTKMDGQVQTVYPRKNWSSVMLWNCEHEANKRLTEWSLNNAPGRDLHAFRWLEDEEIGELPAQWNVLVGEEEVADPKILHFTLGGPWFSNWSGGPFDDLWLREWENAR